MPGEVALLKCRAASLPWHQKRSAIVDVEAAFTSTTIFATRELCHAMLPLDIPICHLCI
jgi:hypothetical protein